MFSPNFSLFVRFSSPPSPLLLRVISYLNNLFFVFWCVFMFVFLCSFFLNIEISMFSHPLRYDIDIYNNIDIRYIVFDMPTVNMYCAAAMSCQWFVGWDTWVDTWEFWPVTPYSVVVKVSEFTIIMNIQCIQIHYTHWLHLQKHTHHVITY